MMLLPLVQGVIALGLLSAHPLCVLRPSDVQSLNTIVCDFSEVLLVVQPIV